MRYPTFLLLCCCCFAQAQNLVPNPSFEHVQKIPTNWSSNGKIFETGIRDWTSPNGGSPDIFFVGNMGKFRFQRPNVDVKPHAPRSGKYMVGIKTYGCLSGTLHCKEYLQCKLKAPLVTGEEYYAEFWVNPIQTSIKVNKFGMLLQEEPMSGGDGKEAIWIEPEFQLEEMVDTRPNNWVRVAGTFTASCDCAFLLIGNFNMDEDTHAERKDSDLGYSYYMIDDVSLRSLKQSVQLSDADLQIGNTIALDRIYFAHDKATLLQKSYPQLNELVEILQNQANMRIQINGHTDEIGETIYNLKLSEMRAQAVAVYLEEKGIDTSRFSFQGFGETQAIATNETTRGRQLNRRVEFVIIEN